MTVRRLVTISHSDTASRRQPAVVVPFVDASVGDHVRWMRLRGLAQNTVDHRLTVLGLLTRHAGRPLLTLTPADLDSWQGSLGLLSAETRRSYVVMVRGYYRWAHDAGLIESNPADVLIVPKVPRGLPRPIGERDLQRALADAPPMLRVWLELAAYAGLRAAEIAVLERCDVVDEAPTPYLVVHGKGGKTRIVPLAPELLRSLRQLGMPAAGRLFRRTAGRGVTARYVSNSANKWLHAHGIRSTIHKLRHRFATAAYRHCHDLRMVQELLGHASPATTAIYTLVDPSAAAPTVAAIDRPLLRPTERETGT